MINIKSTDPQTLHKWLSDNQAVLIDVREPLEYKIEHIARAENIPLSTICLEHVDLPEYKNKKVVIQCRSGARSLSACKKIAESNKSIELYNLDGGILAWGEQGLATIKELKIMSLERQVQLTLGSCIIFGLFMAFFSSSAWLIIPTIIGLGLINAGATGWCGLAKLVAKFPWNKIDK
jgi:rhodanese-related sulfurtransferase